MSLASAYLFLLGLAAGTAVLAMTAFRHVSPRWLRWVLFAVGAFQVGRYVALACFTAPDAPIRFWELRRFWFASAVGLTLPSVVALDQLVRHPAMTPKKLLIRFSPFLAAYGAVILFGSFTAIPDRVAGWALELTGWWPAFVSVVQGAFVILFIGICVWIIRKLPSEPIRTSAARLLVAHAYLAFDGALLAFGGWYFRPFLFSEMLALLALWHAFETVNSLRSV
ncbi:MAG TPA: hypothetical protein VF981_08580 [Gemmatimonadaceae bacterium]